MPGVQRRHRGDRVADALEDQVEPAQAEVAPAASGEPGDGLVDVALLGGHPRRCHRVDDVADEGAEVDGDVAAHPEQPLLAVADPQHRGDGQPGQEVAGVDGGEEDVVPARVALAQARVTAEVLLEPHGRQGAATDPLVEADRHRDVHRQAELVGEAAAVEVDDQADHRDRPVADEPQVVAPRRLDVPGDGAEPQPDEHGDGVVGDAEQLGVRRQRDGVRPTIATMRTRCRVTGGSATDSGTGPVSASSSSPCATRELYVNPVSRVGPGPRTS